jgi:hypothetical protein
VRRAVLHRFLGSLARQEGTGQPEIEAVAKPARRSRWKTRRGCSRICRRRTVFRTAGLTPPGSEPYERISALPVCGDPPPLPPRPDGLPGGSPQSRRRMRQ